MIWWEKYLGVPDFAGLKITQDKKDDQWGIRHITSMKGHDRILTGYFGVVGWGGNSGFHALQLAIQFGSKDIILVGFDMRIDNGSHWHGNHVTGLHNPSASNVERWRRVMDEASDTLKAMRIQVTNTSMQSRLVKYPKVKFSEALRSRGLISGKGLER